MGERQAHGSTGTKDHGTIGLFYIDKYLTSLATKHCLKHNPVACAPRKKNEYT